MDICLGDVMIVSKIIISKGIEIPKKYFNI